MTMVRPARHHVVILLATVLLAGCAGSPSRPPAASPLDVTAVTDALGKSGIVVAEVAANLDPRDGAWRCLPGSFRLARVSQQPAAAFARPGDRPSVDILVFSNDADRTIAEAAIGPDGQVRAQGCGVMVDWVATPHIFGTRNIILFIATDDAAAVAAVQAATAHLGG